MITHDFHRPVNTTPTKVTVVIVHQRPLEHEYMVDALNSLRGQSYPNVECITLFADGITTGAARNAAVQNADGELVMFLGEDDMLAVDTIASMVALYEEVKRTLPGLVHVTTHCMALLKDRRMVLLPNVPAPGMYELSYLKANPFDADLDHRVDDMQRVKLRNMAAQKGEAVTFATTHHYGYVLRVHPFRRDGLQVDL